jgi:hypothetical protein
MWDLRFVPIADMPTRSGQSTFGKKSSPSQGKIKGFFKIAGGLPAIGTAIGTQDTLRCTDRGI